MKMESKKVNYPWVLVYHSYPLPIGWTPSNGFGGQAQYFNKVKKD
jgi:hypothetical protein